MVKSHSTGAGRVFPLSALIFPAAKDFRRRLDDANALFQH
jgi:hypothetical protein